MTGFLQIQYDALMNINNVQIYFCPPYPIATTGQDVLQISRSNNYLLPVEFELNSIDVIPYGSSEDYFQIVFNPFFSSEFVPNSSLRSFCSLSKEQKEQMAKTVCRQLVLNPVAGRKDSVDFDSYGVDGLNKKQR